MSKTAPIGELFPPLRQAPWLSVVIPSHHGEAWLEATLGSLAAQTNSDFECILIDSSTTPTTVDIAERFQDHLHLRIERRPDIKDWQGKTNLGAELATSEHLCMLHQDDLWDPSRAARVHEWLQSDGDVTMHLHPCWIVDERARRLGVWRCPLPPGRRLSGEFVLERLIVQNFVAICAPVIRRDAFLAVGGLDRALWYTADWDLYLKLLDGASVLYHREFLASYRIHSEALTISGSRDGADFEAQMAQVLERHWPSDAVKNAQHLRARAMASIAINVALARTLHRGAGEDFRAITTTLRLGPRGIAVLLRDTRLLERVLPRARLYIRGRLKS